MFESPHPTAPAEALGDYVQPNLGHGLRIWWAFYWPTAVAAFLLAVGFNSAMRLFLHIGLIPDRLIVPVVWASRFDFVIFYYAAAFCSMAYILRKSFHSFRIGLFPNQDWEVSVLLPPTMRRTARVWWAFTWRAVVYRFVAAWVASIPLGSIMGLLLVILPRRVVPFAHLAIQMLIDGAIGMFVIYSSILDEQIADFRVGLLRRETKIATPAVTSASVTPAH